MAHLPYARKSLGQHWLTDLPSLEAMAEAVAVNDQDTILEIGPGAGTLTKVLADRAQRVIAVELDPALVARLPSRVLAQNLEVVQANILAYDFDSVPQPYKVVANIPYYLTSNLIRVLSESANPPSQAALLVQKEVAVRASAQPGQMSLLSVTAQYYWEISLGEIVPALLFTPPPKVDSQILILRQRPEPLFKDVEPAKFFNIVKAGFNERRKTLVNSLSGGLRLAKTDTQALLDKAGLDGRLRAQNLSLEDWHNLYKVI